MDPSLYKVDLILSLLHSLEKISPSILLPRNLHNGKNIPLLRKHINSSSTLTSENLNINTQKCGPDQCEWLPGTGLFSCLACGVLLISCGAIIKPSEVDPHKLTSTDCGNIARSVLLLVIGGLVTPDMLTMLCWIPI